MENIKHKILIVDDDRDILEFLSYNLKKEGFEVFKAENGKIGLEAAIKEIPDLILLDVMMPEMDGIETCYQIKEKPELKNVIVAFLTARNEDYSEISGLEAGADDYVTKPVVPKELAARVRAHLRRAQLQNLSPGASPSEILGDVDLRREQGLVFKNGQEISLTKTEFNLLCEFADHPNVVLSRDQLLERVWGYDYLGDSRLVDAHVRRLRVKIEDQPDDPKLILTVRGIGYRLMPVS